MNNEIYLEDKIFFCIKDFNFIKKHQAYVIREIDKDDYGFLEAENIHLRKDYGDIILDFSGVDWRLPLYWVEKKELNNIFILIPKNEYYKFRYNKKYNKINNFNQFSRVRKLEKLKKISMAKR